MRTLIRVLGTWRRLGLTIVGAAALAALVAPTVGRVAHAQSPAARLARPRE